MDHTISFVLTIKEDDVDLTSRLQEILKPENDETISVEIRDEKELIIKCGNLKASSLYPLVDEFLKAYEIVKQI